MERNAHRLWWAVGSMVIGAIIIFNYRPVINHIFSNVETQSNLVELNFVESLMSTNEKAKTVYDQWSEKYIISTDAGTIVNSSDDSSVKNATSESHGYGMLLTATAKNGTEETFDKLYNYYMNHRGQDRNLMAWQQKYTGDSVTNDDNNATDGDIFIAESLIQAAKR